MPSIPTTEKHETKSAIFVPFLIFRMLKRKSFSNKFKMELQELAVRCRVWIHHCTVLGVCCPWWPCGSQPPSRSQWKCLEPTTQRETWGRGWRPEGLQCYTIATNREYLFHLTQLIFLLIMSCLQDLKGHLLYCDSIHVWFLYFQAVWDFLFKIIYKKAETP